MPGNISRGSKRLDTKPNKRMATKNMLVVTGLEMANRVRFMPDLLHS